MSTSWVSLSPLSQVKIPTRYRAGSGSGSTVRLSAISARLDDSSRSSSQVNLSVLRFTLGIPGLDESYLPRWIGYGFGSLLVLNHFFGSNSASDFISPQLRTEALGLSLAAFSAVLPYLGKFLKGATQVDQTTIPEGSEQIFVMSENVTDTEKEDLAWATYILLRNTNTIAVIEELGISDLKDTLYFPQVSDSELWGMLPKGTRSLLVQPVPQVADSSEKTVETNQGFILVASTISYAYSEKDRAWIGALAHKFCR
ncbi:hypothetical protein TIFTF001_013852 [Ficus carica]|uniref:Protein COFACTOR ASSEMBLY OF COMPLEX C SUBUNIT B CCB2, chloroplastic n=1 Tax=Ficus carica TaxID=3494 RepID=A0AA88A1Q5_FICCA|nr:hypothetical protein TIFTF001_013852 [Ficus carica]